MVLAILFIGIIVVILCFLICGLPDLEDKKDRIFMSFLCNFFIIILLGAMAIAYHISVPAIEVYRGNTALEITYKKTEYLLIA